MYFAPLRLALQVHRLAIEARALESRGGKADLGKRLGLTGLWTGLSLSCKPSGETRTIRQFLAPKIECLIGLESLR